MHSLSPARVLAEGFRPYGLGGIPDRLRNPTLRRLPFCLRYESVNVLEAELEGEGISEVVDR